MKNNKRKQYCEKFIKIAILYSASSASALYSVGLVTAFYTGERERRCLVTPNERVFKALSCFSMHKFCIQMVPFNHSSYKE